MTDLLQLLLKTIARRIARIGIIGLGSVGLPLARTFVSAGFRVLGVDTDANRLARLQKGQSYLKHVPAAQIQMMQRQGFVATNWIDQMNRLDVLLICVSTSLTQSGEPDLEHLKAAANACAQRLRPGQLVVIESTTYPGATRQVVQPILEQSGLKVGADFFLACSPEREDPGNDRYPLEAIPKVVGAIDAQSMEAASALYRQVVAEVVAVSCAEAAEACKLLENAYRAVNIGLVNELKILFDRIGVDVWEVIEAARTKPFGFQAFDPGPGLGGACIPVNPYYLSWLARQSFLTTRLIDEAGSINDLMPCYVVERLIAALRDRGKTFTGSRVALLGIAYKKDVDDCRGSPALALMALLRQEGVIVCYHDPHVPELPVTQPHLHPQQKCQELTPAWLASQDAVIIVTDHSAYDWAWIVKHAALIVDTRNATRNVQAHRERIVKA